MALRDGSFVRSLTGSVDDRKHVLFFKEAVYDEAATQQQGRPIYREEERVEISFPGNQLAIWHGRVTDEHRQQYPREYEAFQRGEEAAVDGTPIEELTVLNKAQVKELKYLGIATIEDAASLNDRVLQTLGMGGRRLRDLSRAYLEKAKDLAPLAELVAVKDNLESQNAQMRAQMEEMNRQVLGLQAQLNAYAQAPRVPETVLPHQPDPHGLGAALPPAPPSSLDSLGEEPKPRRGRPRAV